MKQLEAGSFTSSKLIECPTALRVVSWNIECGTKLNAIIEFLASVDADIVFLQEVDRNSRRTNFLNVAEVIAQQLKMNHVFGCEFEELAEGTRASPAYHGQATLSRWPLAGGEIMRFHKQSSFWQPRWFTPNIRPLQRRRGGRMALFTDVLIPGRKLATYNLHCESRGSDSLRHSQLQEVLRHANEFGADVPVLAAGDFNFDVSLGPAAASIEKMRFLNPFAPLQQTTSNSRSRLARDRIIDWVLLGGPLKAANPKVHNTVVASDHYPLSVTVSLL